MEFKESHLSLLCRAFENDPLFTHLFSNKDTDLSKILISFILKRNRLLDGLFLTDHPHEPSFVAIVERPSTLRKLSLTAGIKLNILMLLMVFQLPFYVLRFLSKYQKLGRKSAPREPHYYITMIGVDPSSQGNGIGKRVLREIHEIADSSQPPYPIALDTENEQNIAYYEGFGYKLIDTKILDGLRIYCMTRTRE